ncbi:MULTISPECIES: hypothetical protein [Legionella]|uniref:Glycosyltransferase family 1 protein n=1 Tax=Legionella septentrionalis TaxID=2498109 RepID=A0A433JH07_9GAMM|nr:MULTISPECIES: hypothetical protein [Legionella]MCP0914362.1 hypothetical protein [Legionella sp. 27cVA30]RUQ81550.1 hypothetical protein EKM59_10415 [Legionella septentrionalis]RUR00285.1 hypothetical protein ELY11_02765 [Legionella septentrionalis]RUR11858.1 hypothetical protein ELY14_01030 [Legionella septentrionalis]RUR17545.1 hypothetical protein ELY10_01025 [Legionella septentrionalis]
MLNILLLCNKPPVGQDANTIVDHIEAIEHYSAHRIWLCSNLGELSPKLDLNRFDAVIIHYSICLLNDYYLSLSAKKRLRDYQGLKIVFVQDEYRQINKMVAELAFLKIDVLFTCFPEEEMGRIYSPEQLPNVAKYNNLTGYIPERLTTLAEQIPIKERPIHVGYRGRKLPFWYGELAYEKWNIVEKWLTHANRADLTADVSFNERERIYGKDWIKFLSACKTTLGVESGASVMDFTGELEKNIDFHQLTHPNEPFHVVQEKFLRRHEGQYKLNQISPRCFEAIALKTVLVLYEGEYSNILVPGRHYISLKKDFSNIEAVLACIRNDDYLQTMADTAFQEIALNPAYSYRTFINKVDEIIRQEFKLRHKKIVEAYEEGQYQAAMRYISLKSRFYKTGLRIYQKMPEGIRLLIKGVLRPKAAIRYVVRSFYRVVRPLPRKGAE